MHQRVDAAHAREAQVTFLLDVGDHHADFIHVGGEDDFLSPAGPFFECHQTAQGVNPHRIREWGDDFPNDSPDFFFVPRRAKSLSELG
ncbi:MAG: hypothetical protein BWY63_02697 [Chloroflexi bacterium ADurb.Bin360]|nr:MAG: hypothetical protein BWY63_02697 [Chloroflexi bacterium ADurb.Bin360]